MIINEALPLPELLAMLAEESMELGHAALKLRRVLDGTNPTPVKCRDAIGQLNEEIADVRLCMSVLTCTDEKQIFRTMAEKKERWISRLKERMRDDQERKR